jgi:dTDP-4-dehydrorhamnose reductase
MRILVLGAKGMLGADLLDEWQSDELIPADSAEADLRDFPQVEKLVLSVRPEWIVLAAAYTDVDGCEQNPELAFAVNQTGVENVARAARLVAARVFFVSTDYVFDGKSTRPYETTDPVSPLNVYGASKAAGETALSKSQVAWCVGRTSWLFGVHGPSFPEKILRAAETRPELSVVSDQIGSPTYTRDLARVIRALLSRDVRGFVHITNQGICSWFDFAREILAQSGRESIKVLPITTDQAARSARRPNYSVLSPASLQAFGIRTRPWQEALRAFLKEKSSQPVQEI